MRTLIRLGSLLLALSLFAACGGGTDNGNGFMPRSPLPGPTASGP